MRVKSIFLAYPNLQEGTDGQCSSYCTVENHYWLRRIILKTVWTDPQNGNPAIQIQTNGTLITQRTAELFHQYDVGIVVSLDGPKSLHDEYRKNAGGFGTYSMVMRAIDLLRNNRVDVSALATVTELSSSRAKDIFTFFSCLGMDFSVNRCFPVLGMQGGISEQTYQTFLSMLFDLYRPTDSEHCGIKIPCFDRCIHDLKWDGSSYCYNPHVSPYVSVFAFLGRHLVLLLTERTNDLTACWSFAGSQKRL